MPKVAKGTYKLPNPDGGRNVTVTKNMLYDDDDPVVRANPSLFEEPDAAARRQAPIVNTSQLGRRAMSTRKPRARTARRRPVTEDELTCPDCGFEAASASGLAAHRRSH